MKQHIHYKREGQPEGRLIVFLHGILGGWRNFRTISRAFQDDFSVLLYDQRGHGLSLYEKPYTVYRLAQDLKELLQDLGRNKASLVGHSLGGYVALAFAELYPECVEKTVIVDSSPWPLAEQGEKISQLIKSLPDEFADTNTARGFFQKAVKRGDFSQLMADFLRSSLRQGEQGRFAIITPPNKLGPLRQGEQGAVRFLFDKQKLPDLLADIRQRDWPSLIKKQNSPALLLRGENSTHFLKSDFERAKQLNPLFRLEEIKSSGHWIPADQPKALIQILGEFLG